MLPGTSAQVEIYFKNNDERAQSGEDYIKQYVRNYQTKLLPSRYKNIKGKIVKIHNVDAYRFIYEDDPKPKGITITSGTISFDELRDLLRKKEEKKGRKKTDKLRKYTEYLLVDFDGTFFIRASVEKDKYDQYKELYYTIPDYFTPILEKRW